MERWERREGREGCRGGVVAGAGVREARRGSAYEGLGGLRAEYRHGWRGRRTQGRD